MRPANTTYLYQYEAQMLLKLVGNIIHAYKHSALVVDRNIADAIIKANAFIETRELKS